MIRAASWERGLRAPYIYARAVRSLMWNFCAKTFGPSFRMYAGRVMTEVSVTMAGQITRFV
jgi:hypothetical protein